MARTAALTRTERTGVAVVVLALAAAVPIASRTQPADAAVECEGSDLVEVVPFDDVAADSPFCSAIATLVADGIITGIDEDTFGGTLPITRAAVAVLLHRAAGAPEGPFGDQVFTDVPLDATFGTEIQWLAASGAATGNDDGSYGPTEPISRGEFTALLFRLAGSPGGPFAAPGFSDVATGGVFFDAIAWAADGSIVAGNGDGTFTPGDDITRAATAGVLAPFLAVTDLPEVEPTEPSDPPVVPEPRPDPSPTPTIGG